MAELTMRDIIMTPEFTKFTNTYNNSQMKIMNALASFNGDSSDAGKTLKRLRALSVEYIRQSPNDLLLVGGELLFKFAEDIANDNVDKLLNEDYTKFIFESVNEDGKKFIIDIITIIKNSWVNMKEKEQNLIRDQIKLMLGTYIEYNLFVQSKLQK